MHSWCGVLSVSSLRNLPIAVRKDLKILTLSQYVTVIVHVESIETLKKRSVSLSLFFFRMRLELRFHIRASSPGASNVEVQEYMYHLHTLCKIIVWKYQFAIGLRVMLFKNYDTIRTWSACKKTTTVCWMYQITSRLEPMSLAGHLCLTHLDQAHVHIFTKINPSGYSMLSRCLQQSSPPGATRRSALGIVID